jgi:hypothetical protein
MIKYFLGFNYYFPVNGGVTHSHTKSLNGITGGDMVATINIFIFITIKYFQSNTDVPFINN